MSVNEPVVSRRPVVVGSNRTFGLVFAAVFGIVALWPLVSGGMPRPWAAVLAVAFLAVALVAPRLLSPLNRAWFHVGLTLHRVVNPIVMAIIYYGTVVPVGLILRARGKDMLRLKRDPNARSYWIERDPPGPPRGSMTKQF
jgi:saxitoxin biosynthesis operon SxtJ-like protein